MIKTISQAMDNKCKHNLFLVIFCSMTNSLRKQF